MADIALQLPAVLDGLLTAFIMIVVTELGDKTFFIAALLSMKRGALIVFTGSFTALVLMTALSASAGQALPAIISPRVTQVASVVLFAVFGAKLLWEGYRMTPGEGCEELAEAEKTITHQKDAREVELSAIDPEDPGKETPHNRLGTFAPVQWRARFPPGFVEAFSLTFAAEWGDRSQIATLALGASKNIWGVNFGAILGHCACTALAVLSGKAIAAKVSERTITITGGFTFLFFAGLGAALEVQKSL